MGLFTADEPLDNRIATALLTTDRNAQRILAKGQPGILAALNGEPLSLVVIDEITHDTTVAVAGRRVHIFRNGGKRHQRVVDATEIEIASAEGSRVLLSGIGIAVPVTFQDRQTAATFATRLNKLIIACRPRAVPILYPQYFLEIIATSGAQATVVNVLRLIERTAMMLGAQGATYCAQLKDPQALEELISRFARGGPPDRQLQIVDDMVDWLWAWNPGCHRALVQQFQKWRVLLLAPDSPLVAGSELPPYISDSGHTDHAAIWRYMYATNQRKGRVLWG